MADLGERLEQFTGKAGKTGVFAFTSCAVLDFKRLLSAAKSYKTPRTN